MQSGRYAGGYLMSSPHRYLTTTHPLVSTTYGESRSNDWFVATEVLGSVRIHVTAAQPLFLGIGPAQHVERHLAATLNWTPRAGSWRMVVMNTAGGPRVVADISAGGRFPHLTVIAVGLLGPGILLSLGCGAVIHQIARGARYEQPPRSQG